MTVTDSLRIGEGPSVGSRISWGAILGGAALALALNFLLMVLGSAVGLSIGERAQPSTLLAGTIGWALVTLFVSLFVGGVITSQFTLGESKFEGVIHGIIMWGVCVVMLVLLGGMGVRAGFNGMWAVAHQSADGGPGWEMLARQAGVPTEQIDAWRRQSATSADKTDRTARPAVEEAASKVAWYVFAGAWGSMIAAAAGAWLAAGPTFRTVTIRT